MLKLFSFLLFSISLLAQDIDKNDVFDQSALKIIGVQTEYALKNCPTLLYHAYLINSKNGNIDEVKEAMRLYSLGRVVLEHNRAQYVDSIIQKVEESSLNILKKKKMISLLNDYEGQMIIDIDAKVVEYNLVKNKLNYDDNHELYYEYCYLLKDFDTAYDSLIDYKDILNNYAQKFNISFQQKIEGFASLNKENQRKLIDLWMKSWLVVKLINYSKRVDVINLLSEYFNEGYTTENKVILNLSAAYLWNGEFNSIHKVPFDNETKSTKWVNNFNSYFNFSFGYRLKMREEKTLFSWIEFSAGFSMYSYKAHEELLTTNRFFIKEDYVSQRGRVEEYIVYEKRFDNKSNTSYHFSINVPVYYFYDNFYASAGLELIKFNLIGNYSVISNKEVQFIGENVVESSLISKNDFSNKLKEIKVNPFITINYEIISDLILTLQGSFHMSKLGLTKAF